MEQGNRCQFLLHTARSGLSGGAPVSKYRRNFIRPYRECALVGAVINEEESAYDQMTIKAAFLFPFSVILTIYDLAPCCSDCSLDHRPAAMAVALY